MSHMTPKDKMSLRISSYLKFLGLYWSFHPFHSIQNICQYLLGDCHVPGIKASVVKSEGKETDLVPALVRLTVHKGVSNVPNNLVICLSWYLGYKWNESLLHSQFSLPRREHKGSYSATLFPNSKYEPSIHTCCLLYTGSSGQNLQIQISRRHRYDNQRSLS